MRAPSNPAVFLANLEAHALDPTFEAYGNFAETGADGKTHFHGNFADVAAVFTFRLEGEEATRVELAIRRHQRTGRYMAAKTRQREAAVRAWAQGQRQRGRAFGPEDLTMQGGLALRLLQQGELEKAERVMAREGRA